MPEISQREVHEFLNRFVSAYEKGGSEFFDLFAPDATVFSVTSPNRIDGREAYRHGFEGQLTSKVKRVSQILSPVITPLADGALVSYLNRIQVDGHPFELRASLFLTRPQAGGGLQISHLHNSAQTAAALPAGAAPSLEAVRILEERVATAVAAVGTPK